MPANINLVLLRSSFCELEILLIGGFSFEAVLAFALLIYLGTSVVDVKDRCLQSVIGFCYYWNNLIKTKFVKEIVCH